MFVCRYWQWPILINCMMCYYLCVLRWLMRPILALNCLLQIEQERSEEESSVGDALVLAFCCSRFCSASLILFALYSPAPLFSSPELCSGWAIVITFRPSSVRACVCPSVNIFNRLLLWNRWANFAQISYGASLGWGNEKLLKWLRSVDQDGRHARIW